MPEAVDCADPLTRLSLRCVVEVTAALGTPDNVLPVGCRDRCASDATIGAFRARLVRRDGAELLAHPGDPPAGLLLGEGLSFILAEVRSGPLWIVIKRELRMFRVHRHHGRTQRGHLHMRCSRCRKIGDRVRTAESAPGSAVWRSGGRNTRVLVELAGCHSAVGRDDLRQLGLPPSRIFWPRAYDC